ncbi:hypothetical protein ACFXAE_23555 [Streptomyces sp. NPDC059454]|uniref:hypothetical protein n=1 Tax=Streptomyces sp. NPDC059454 TaxID=3346836 RepID=UPI0036A7EF6B
MIDFHGFCLQDADDSWIPSLFPRDFDAGIFLSSKVGRLDIGSAGHTHTAEVTVEVWDSQPLQPAGEWDETGMASIICKSGLLKAWAVAGGPMPDAIELPEAGKEWAVRVACSGRSEVARLSRESVPQAVEKYLMQFWLK